MKSLLTSIIDPNIVEPSGVAIESVPVMECFAVNSMMAVDKKGSRRDKINIQGSLKLPEDTCFDPEIDDVTVTINEQEITIPAGSFEEKSFFWLHYYCFKGDIPDVGFFHMRINFDRCFWQISIYGKDAGDIVISDGASVRLSIGGIIGEDSFDWTWKWNVWKRAIAWFYEWPGTRCCPKCCPKH